MKRIPVQAEVTKNTEGRFLISVTSPHLQVPVEDTCLSRQNVGRTARSVAARSLDLPERKIDLTKVVYK